jgi:hypothetical protein
MFRRAPASPGAKTHLKRRKGLLAERRAGLQLARRNELRGGQLLAVAELRLCRRDAAALGVMTRRPSFTSTTSPILPFTAPKVR